MLATCLIQSLKIGADHNYLIEVLVLSAAVAAWGIALLWRGQTHDAFARVREFAWWLILVPCLLYALQAQIRVNMRSLRMAVGAWKPLAIERVARDCGRPILSTNPFVALTVNRPLDAPLDHVHYGIMAERRQVDTDLLLQRLRRGAFTAVILGSSTPDTNRSREQWRALYGPGFLPALEARYVLRGRIASSCIFIPKAR
jgi:hypothetical protein